MWLSMFTKEQYMNYVDKGLLSLRRHPQFTELIILNYTDECVYERAWDSTTLACRGMIINEKTGELIARPFPKFFNYLENLGNGKLAEPILDEEPEVTTKMDGSLGISYVYKNNVYWATRGSFESEQAKVAQRIWDRDHKDSGVPDDMTLLVEIIDPRTRVVVNYDGYSNLVLIGAKTISDGKDSSYEQLINISKYVGLPVTQNYTFYSLKTMQDIVSNMSHNEEGFVLRWSNGYRLKMKGDAYLSVHRIIHGLSIKQKVESWANGTIKGIVRQVPEEFRPEIEATAVKCEDIFQVIKDYVNERYKNAEKRGRKAYALWVQKHVDRSFQGFMFKKYDGHDDEVIDDEIKSYVLKNYREYFFESITENDGE